MMPNDVFMVLNSDNKAYLDNYGAFYIFENAQLFNELNEKGFFNKKDLLVKKYTFASFIKFLVHLNPEYFYVDGVPTPYTMNGVTEVDRLYDSNLIRGICDSDIKNLSLLSLSLYFNGSFYTYIKSPLKDKLDHIPLRIEKSSKGEFSLTTNILRSSLKYEILFPNVPGCFAQAASLYLKDLVEYLRYSDIKDGYVIFPSHSLECEPVILNFQSSENSENLKVLSFA
jgi:hypothetical protein